MKILDNIVALFVIAIIFIIVFPLPPAVLDILIIINFAISLTILLLAINIKETLEFSVFPTVIMVTTLFRVSLTIASTRLILGNAGDAGQIIETFGEFVLGGSVMVGIIVFLIIIIVQFVVITRGAERVAEVSARFTLDAMPGKQMAIDADLSSGLIDETTAKIRREKIQKEADFYGAMDGATKFVKGDAIVSIIVIFINIIAGTIIGVSIEGMEFSEALNVYTIATVGDGLVAQIPALMCSVATGIVVTKSASEGSLTKNVTTQLGAQPRVFMLAGGGIIGLSIIPGMPKLPLILFGGGLILLGYQLGKKREKKKVEEKKVEKVEKEVNKATDYRTLENVYDLLQVEQIEMEFGYSLIPLVDEKRGGSVASRLVMLRRQFAQDLGVVLPSIALRDSVAINSNEYTLKIRGEEIVRGEILVGYYLAMNSDDADEDLDGIETVDAAFGMPAKWIPEDMYELAQIKGYIVIDAVSVIITHISEVLAKHMYELIGRKEVKSLLDNYKKLNKDLVDEVVPGVISIGELQKVLVSLLYERIPIKDLSTILECISDHAPTTKDPEMLSEYIRQGLKRTITRKFTQNGEIKVLSVNPDLENIIINSVKKSEQGSYLAMDPDMMQKIVLSHTAMVRAKSDNLSQVVILTSPIVRIYYRKLIEQFTPNVIVLSFSELESNVRIKTIGTIDLPKT